ncbi:MAG: PD40 domain-containing protein [Desulfobacterales bacterium]|nr:PD40 domain-containing protein [Desulfobacterales bacterium]
MILRFMVIALLTAVSTHGHAFEPQASMPTAEKSGETTTEHFHIIFQEPLRDAVPYLAEQCEEAYETLTPIFEWYPQEKTEVLFIDAFDTHNGWATSIPHNRMAVYAAGAEPGSTIFQPGNYLRNTVYHELTHVLTMDMRYGYNRTISGIFGKMLPVNDDPVSCLLFYFSASPVALTPPWYLEGTAIWAETEFAPPGRGRASIPDMIFRAAVQERNPLPYSRWDLDIPHWPYGLGAYLYGMKLIQYAYEQSSAQEPVGALTQDIAHAFMFDFDSRSKKVTDKSFERFAWEMLQHEKDIQWKNIEELIKLTPTQVPRLTPHEIIVYQPVFAGDKIYFSAREEEARDSLYAYIPEEKKTQKIARARTTAAFGSLSVSPDSRYVYYTRLEVQQKDNHFYEVRRFDTKSQTDTLVTDSGRYRAIDISPGGKRMVAVSMRAGKSFLLEASLAEAGDPEKETILIHAPFQHDLSSPRYSPDGGRIAYVRGDEDGFSLLVFDLKERTSRVLHKSRRQLLFPTWHPAGKSIVFSSDENGVYNLYEMPADGAGEPAPLTHVIGGVFSSDFAPGGKEIAAVAYDSRGYYLTLLPHGSQALNGKKLPRIHTTWKGKKRENKEAATDKAISGMDAGLRPYSSFRNIRFDYWGPWLTVSPDEVEGGIRAVFSDPAGYQNLRLLAGVESKYETPLGSIQYTYKGFYPTFHMYAGQDQEVYPGLVKAADESRYDYAEQVGTVGAAVDIPLIKLDRRVSLQIGYQFLEREFIEKSGDAYLGKTIITPDLSKEDEGAVWVRLSYFDGTAFKRSSSVEDGRFIAATTEKTDPELGGGLSRTRTLGEWHEYISNPWAKNRVLKLSGSYGFGHGDRTAQGLFGLGGFGNPISSTSPGMPRSITLRGYVENFSDRRPHSQSLLRLSASRGGYI